MAFNFNWSPLTADASFYTRAQDLLTAALNKSPKPPIIVDDIIVTELNLGSIPPELEILEIGDLAEDRFRGIFKMCYSGDAFLTLKTRVQANPLNTYLSTRPAFASPQPLAAATGLTIPLQITLSNIRLSAFIIVVFSKQKGLTLVFRNDPLESLKVSSTFDSIPFVRDYLQRTIDAQLRVLFMDELPAIIHRLSLRLWVPEFRAREDEELAAADKATSQETAVDPLASPPQDPVDSTGNVLDAAEIASLSLDSGVETQSLFSQKNLLRLATLTDSQRTLSLFTPSIRDTVFRAWAGATERGEGPGINSPTATPALSRTHSHLGSATTNYADADADGPVRPSLTSFASSGHGVNMGPGRHSKAHAKKRKRRVVNLRRTTTGDHLEVTSEDGESTTASETMSAPSVFTPPPAIVEDAVDDLKIPPYSGESTVKAGKAAIMETENTSSARLQPPQQFRRRPIPENFRNGVPAHSENSPVEAFPEVPAYPTEKSESGPPSRATALPNLASFVEAGNGSSILEQAWMMKMAGEMARRIQDEKAMGLGPSSSSSWERIQREQSPPPAYGQ